MHDTGLDMRARRLARRPCEGLESLSRLNIPLREEKARRGEIRRCTIGNMPNPVRGGMLVENE